MLYPIGHQCRRADGIPLLMEKFATNLHRIFPETRAKTIYALCKNADSLATTPVDTFIDALVID